MRSSLYFLVLACLTVFVNATWPLALWRKEPQWGQNPGRKGAGAMVNVGLKLVHFGGVVECFDQSDPNCDHVWYDETHEYNLLTKRWVHPTPAVRPAKRGFMGADKHDRTRSMIIFGGAEYNVSVSFRQWYGDMWSYNIDTNTWTQITYNNAGPGPLLGPQIQIKDDTVYLFGGIDESFQVRGEFWTFNLNTRLWTLVATQSTTPSLPPPRFIFQFRMNHPTDTKIFLHGGNFIPGAGFQRDDSYVYDISSNTWTNITGPFPGRTHAAGGAFLDKFVVALGDINDDAENGTECATNQASKGQNPTDEVWSFDLHPTPKWTERHPVHGPTPLKRIASTSAGSRMYVYGGFDFICPDDQTSLAIYYTDLWSLSLLPPLFP